MKVDNVYIGEVYEKTPENNEEKIRRIGYRSFIYCKEDNYYEDLKNNQKYGTDENCEKHGPRFIKKDSIIPFSLFAKKPLIFSSRDNIYYICHRETEKRNKKYLINRYDSLYTPEETEAIHERGELTIKEKAEDYLAYDVCPLGDHNGKAVPRCRQYKNQSCKECLCDYLEKTGSKSFKKLELKATRSIYDTFK